MPLILSRVGAAQKSILGVFLFQAPLPRLLPTCCFQAWEEGPGVRAPPAAPRHRQAALRARVVVMVIAGEVRQEATSNL